MGKLRSAVHPYTFRAKLVLSLIISSILAGVIALVLSYFISHLNIKDELTQTERSLAIYLLEMDQKTELSVEQIISMAQQDQILVSVVPTEGEKLDGELMQLLEEQLLYTVSNGLLEQPVTFVKMEEDVLRIEPAHDYNLFLIALLRILFGPATFLLIFAMLAVLAGSRASKPVAQLTGAFSQVQEGDFNVRLPEDEPGETGQLMRSFNAMAEALERTAYLQKDFISSVSHEFRTPIASIKGYAHLLQMPGVDETQRREWVGCIAQESDRLSRLSETLLRLTALEQQSCPATVSCFRLDEQVRQVILRLEPAWAARNIDWQLELSDVSIESDEALLSHVWVNLLQNAVKFSPEGGVIAIHVYAADKAFVEIRDEGPGMDAQTVARIFDRFYQADTSRSNEGVGLGLCLVKRILDMLGGHVKVCSKPNEGSTFRVQLPLKPVRTGKEGTTSNDQG